MKGLNVSGLIEKYNFFCEMLSFPECKLPLHLISLRGGGWMSSYFCCHSYLHLFLGLEMKSSGQVCGVKLDAGAPLKSLYDIPHLLTLAFSQVFLMPFFFFIKSW